MSPPTLAPDAIFIAIEEIAMSFFQKPATSLQESDLEWLVLNRIAEADRIDFKRDMYAGDDDSRRELLKDVTSFANHRGGYIVIGIGEDDENCAKDLVGVPPGNHVTWIQSLCLSGIDGRILGLDIVEVPLANGRTVIVIEVPLSASGPHMVTFKGLNQFWKRHGRQKDRMSIEEIRDGFLRVADAQTRREHFLISRHGEAIERSGGRCVLLLSAMPLHFRDETIVDVRSPSLRALAATPPRAAGGNGRDVNCGPLRPTLEGVAAHLGDSYEPRSLQVFRNGYLEFSSVFSPEVRFGLIYAGIADTEYIVSFTGFAAGVFSQLLGGIPMVLRVVIINAYGMILAASRRADTNRRWERRHLDLGVYVLEDPARGWQALPKQVCDRLWNAFGYEQCTLIDEAARLG